MRGQIQGRIRDRAHDRGMEGVMVSNGEHVIRTDAEGRYVLAVEPGAHTFVRMTVPDGFRPIERFYQAVPEEGGTLDFELVPALERQRRDFRLAQITDTHVEVEEGRLSWRELLARELRELVEEAQPDFIVASGDLTNRGSLEELRHFREAIETIDASVFPLFGGHDGNEERSTGEVGTTFIRHYEQILGPAYFSFDWGGRHFVFWASEEHFFSEEDQKRKAAWLWADLEMQPVGQEIVVVMHTPPNADFLEQLSRFEVGAVLYGHWHSSKAFTHGEIAIVAAPPLCFGGIDTEPRGYRLVEFGERGMGFALRAVQIANVEFERPREISLGERILSLVWEREVPGGGHRAAPVGCGDSILVSLKDEELCDRAGLECIEIGGGGTEWRVSADASIKNRAAVDDQGHCAAVSITGRVYLIELVDGKVRWETDLPGYPDRWIYTTPVIADDAVHAGGKAGFGAYCLDTGAPQWYRSLESSDNWSCYARPLVYGNLLIVLVQRRGVLALERQTGEIIWERELGVEYQYATPVLAGDLLVSGGDAGKLAVLEAGSGEMVWQEDLLGAAYPTGLAVTGERIYATTPEGTVRCCDLGSGQLCWEFQSGEDLLDMIPYHRGGCSILGEPVVWEERVVVGGNDGMLYILDVRDGTCVSRTRFGVPISAAPCVVGGGICVGTWDGRLCFFG